MSSIYVLIILFQIYLNLRDNVKISIRVQDIRVQEKHFMSRFIAVYSAL